jgi:hypothetical protein|tara:strand:- start:575 stop:1054 length:480 start_codon:yes stop_codon:yes gene_type:complete
MKFARTIRFDKSDLNIFPLASEEGELAVVGTFSFYNIKPEDLKGKVKQAFSNGFLGCSTFGFSTLVSLVSINENEIKKLQINLGQYFIDNYGAPSKEVAEKAASEEINFMLDLCKEHELGSLLSLSREFSEEGIKEKFRNLPKADSCAEQKIWTVVEED